jgi:hypothetical protein
MWELSAGESGLTMRLHTSIVEYTSKSSGMLGRHVVPAASEMTRHHADVSAMNGAPDRRVVPGSATRGPSRREITEV